MICTECGIQHGDLYVRTVDGRVVPVQSELSARLLGYDDLSVAIVRNGVCTIHLPEPTLLRRTQG